MNKQSPAIQEQEAAAAFSKQAPLFDKLYQPDAIIQYKRKRVRQHMENFLQPGAHILELNAGTGDDALYFGGKGYKVHATDISQPMLNLLQQKVKQENLESFITQEQCSFTELDKLWLRGPYDHIFSNFAGLNCTGRLEKVLATFNWLLKPGGYATLVILPRFCLWETLLLFRGKFKTAFRRFTGRKGAKAHIEGSFFRCWYYNPSFVRRHLQDSFNVVALEGLCCFVPPSYIENFAVRYPAAFRRLEKLEQRWKSKWPWNVTGDYYIITLQKNTRN